MTAGRLPLGCWIRADDPFHQDRNVLADRIVGELLMGRLYGGLDSLGGMGSGEGLGQPGGDVQDRLVLAIGVELQEEFSS
nr:hypothetical protein [Kribbella antiqua]